MSRNKNNISFFSENFQVMEVKFSVCLNRRVFVMIVFFWYLLETLISSAAKRTSRWKAFSEALEIKRSHRDSGQVNKVDGLKLSPFQKPKKT